MLILLGRLVQFALMFLTVKVMTTLLGPEQYGLLSLYLAVNLLFGFVFVNPVGTYINRHLVLWKNEGSLFSKFKLFLPYWFGVAGVCVGALLLLRHLGVSFVDEPTWALLLCSLLVLSSTLFNTLVPSLNLLGHDKPFVVLTVAGSLLILVLSSLAVSSQGGFAEHWLLGMVAAHFVIVLIGLYVYRRIGYHSEHPKTDTLQHLVFESVIPYAWPVLLYTALIWSSFQGYRFVIEDTFSLLQLGLVVAGYSVAIQVLAATEQIANTWFLPRFYAQCDAQSQAVQSNAAAEYLCAFTLPILLAAVAVLTGVDLLIKAMLGPAFQSTQQYLIIGVVIEVFRIVANAAGLRFHQTHQTKKLIGPAFAALVFIFLINVFVEPSLQSIMGSMAAGSLLLFVLMLDKNLVRQLLATTSRQINISKTIIFVAACVLLTASQAYFNVQTHAFVWLSIWSAIGFIYLRSVLKQVASA